MIANKPKKILITGIGKSGTTALYFKIFNSIKNNSIGYFEPSNLNNLKLSKSKNIVVKFLMNKNFNLNTVDKFDRVVYITRDPRDIIISAILYLGGYHYLWNKTDKTISTFINILRKKEKNPKSYSVLYILNYLHNILESTKTKTSDFNITKTLLFPIKILKSKKNIKIIKYEDFIDNKQMPSLEKYLNIKLINQCSVDNKYSRVIRTKSRSSWKNWFTYEDINYFKPKLHSYLKFFNYNTLDWDLNKIQKIKPENSSEYILKLINERKRKNVN